MQDKREKGCPRCKQKAENLATLQGIVFIEPCRHTAVYIESPISKALGTILLLGTCPILFSKDCM
jgi:hypothetical protein